MSQEQGSIEVRVFRFNPSFDEEPRYEVYNIPFVEGSSVGPIGQWLGFQFKMPWTAAQLTVTVTANNTEVGKDLIFDGTPPRYDAWEDGP